MADKNSEYEEEATDTTLKIIETDINIAGSGRIIAKVDGQTPALSCSVLPDNNLIAVGWSDGTIQALNMETFEELYTLRRSKNLPTTFLSGYSSKDANQILLASYASGETVIWDIQKGEEMWTVNEDRQSFVNDFSCDFSRFAIGGSDAKISVYDTAEQKLVQVLQGSMDPDVMDGHTMRVFAARFHPTHKFELLSGGWDDTVQFWDVREPFSRRKIRGPHICGDGIVFFEDNKIITASWTKRNPLQMWDYRTEKLLQNIKPDDLPCFLYCCQYVKASSILLAGGSNKNMLRIIDKNNFKNLAIFRNLHGAVYFARALPKSDSYSLTTKICFCSDTSVYVAESDV